MSQSERQEHYKRWTTEREPAIKFAEAARKHNGIDTIRSDDDLHEQLFNQPPVDDSPSSAKAGCFLRANNQLIACAAYPREDASDLCTTEGHKWTDGTTERSKLAKGGGGNEGNISEDDNGGNYDDASLLDGGKCLLCNKAR